MGRFPRPTKVVAADAEVRACGEAAEERESGRGARVVRHGRERRDGVVGWEGGREEALAVAAFGGLGRKRHSLPVVAATSSMASAAAALLLFLHLQLLLLLPAPSAAQPGFISLDCGGAHDHADAIGIQWTSDASFVSGGQTAQLLVQNGLQSQQFTTVRYFPADNRKYCYTMNVRNRTRYLVRATFLYGNFDNSNVYPKFDISLGASPWSTIVIDDATTPVDGPSGLFSLSGRYTVKHPSTLSPEGQHCAPNWAAPEPRLSLKKKFEALSNAQEAKNSGKTSGEDYPRVQKEDIPNAEAAIICGDSNWRNRDQPATAS
nr:unnamed protein product [Digitaria exilis]